MPRSHSHARPPAAQGERSARRPSQILPLRSAQMGEQNKLSPFLEWPSYLFELMMAPWLGMARWGSMLDRWQPEKTGSFLKTESRENAQEYRYEIDLPGVRRDQVSLSLENGSIILKVKEGDHNRKPRGSVHRALSLPVYTNSRHISARLHNGVLIIRIPKTHAPVPPQSRIIEIIDNP